MTNRFTKYGCMIIAAVLLVALAFAGAASADYVEVSTWEQLNTSVAEWTNTETARIVAVNTSINDRASQNHDGIEVNGKVILTVTASPVGGNNEAVINGNGQGRLFYVTGTGNLTLIGNVSTGAVLNLTGGKMTGNEDDGGAIYVDGGGNLTLNSDAMITNSVVAMYPVSPATWYNYCGGGVYVKSGGAFTMTGGSIINCSAESGGGVYVTSGGAFTMTGGSIINCIAEYNGSNGQCGGGAVSLDGGTFTMTGDASISNCTANLTGSLEYAGGGAVYIKSTGTFTMTGGSITGCTATDGSGGVHMWQGTFNVSGSATVSGNTVSNVANNVDSDEWNNYLNLVGDLTGRIGIAFPGAALGVQFGDVADSTCKGAWNFVSDSNASLVGSINGTMLVWAERPIIQLILNANGGTGGSTSVNVTYGFAELDAEISNPTRDGYSFVGWYDAAKQGVMVIGRDGELVRAVAGYTDDDGNWIYLDTASVTLYAHWKAHAQPSSKDSGSTIILTATPTPVPTATLTPVPTATATPGVNKTVVPINKTQTSKSPAPFVGLIAGLGAAAVLLRMRK